METTKRQHPWVGRPGKHHHQSRQLPVGYYDTWSYSSCCHCGRALVRPQRKFCNTACQMWWWASFDWWLLKRLIHDRDNWTCRRCGIVGYEPGILQADHIIPLSAGGPEFELMNLRTLCVPCHKLVTKEWFTSRKFHRASYTSHYKRSVA